MPTNYSKPKLDVADSLYASTLPAEISNKILKSLSKTVYIAEFDTVPTGPELRGKDLVLIDIAGTVNLSGISAGDLNGIDAFIFTTNEDVTFSLSGAGTGGFKGVVVTNGGDDIIELNSTLGATVSSGDGNDSVTTGSGNDSVLAGSGDDSVNTGAGNDTVSTGSGDDSVNTGIGNDSVLVGSGDDSVDTGAGTDIVKLADGFSGDAQLGGGAGNLDKLDLRFMEIDFVSQTGGVVTITLDNGSEIIATSFEKFIYDSNGAADGGIVTVGVNQFDAAFPDA